MIKLISRQMAARKKHLKVEYEQEESSDSKKTKFAPKNWEKVLENIREMRKNHDAPVDSMGCEQCADKKANIKIQQYQILVALMLSSQTKDTVTFPACQRLKDFGFTVESLATASIQEIENIIKPVGFYHTKAKHIKQASQMLIDDFNGEVPNDLQSLLKLPGVGKKMANIALSSCFGNVVGIGVDVHVHRIANRLKWTSKLTKTPEQTQMELENWLPRDIWREVNLLLVGFGQQICTPKNPNCSGCLNSINNLCPNAFKEVSPTKNKKRDKYKKHDFGMKRIYLEGMFWKCCIGFVLLKLFSMSAYVIDREKLVPDDINHLKANLSLQNVEVMANLFQGDMAIDNRDFNNLKLGIDFTQFSQYKWPNLRVPYKISALYSDGDVATIKLAIRKMNSLSCVKFKPRVDEEDFIMIWPVEYPSGCWSLIGKRGGAQLLSLTGTDSVSTCLNGEGIAMHELMHAVGILHEQSRADRDNFVEIIYENIIPGFESQFAVFAPNITTISTEYDYESIMHYGENYFSKDPRKPTIRSKIPGKKLGQRRGLSKFDCFRLNSLYGCFDDEKMAKKYRARCLHLTVT